MPVRRNILTAQLRVALDKERGRVISEAVKRLAPLDLPPLRCSSSSRRSGYEPLRVRPDVSPPARHSK